MKAFKVINSIFIIISIFSIFIYAKNTSLTSSVYSKNERDFSDSIIKTAVASHTSISSLLTTSNTPVKVPLASPSSTPIPTLVPAPQNKLRALHVVTTKVNGKPAYISIPTVGINTPIDDGTYNSQKNSWNVSESTAHFAVMTELANNIGGNTLIYAHNRSNLFGATTNIKSGDKAYITTTNGYRFTYEYVGDKIVKPTNVSIFNYQGAPQLTLLTCYGKDDIYRREMFFRLSVVEK